MTPCKSNATRSPRCHSAGSHRGARSCRRREDRQHAGWLGRDAIVQAGRARRSSARDQSLSAGTVQTVEVHYFKPYSSTLRYTVARPSPKSLAASGMLPSVRDKASWISLRSQKSIRSDSNSSEPTSRSPKSSDSISSANARTTALSITLRNWRTFPGQL